MQVTPGIHTATELVPAGWKLWDIDCSDGNSTGNEATATATFNVSPWELVICTFTNKKKGKIIVKKKTYPTNDYSTTFSFSGDLAGSLKNGETLWKYVDSGTYYSTEASKDGWKLTDLDCDDYDSIEDETNRKATFKVAWGETVTCTFTNTKKSKIIVKKKTDPSNDYSTVFSFSGDLAGSLKNGETLWKYVEPGTYYSTEAYKDGWKLTGLDCDDSDSVEYKDDRKAKFIVSAGETVTCTFTNTKKSKIIVKKKTDPSSDYSTVFTFTGDLAGLAEERSDAREVRRSGHLLLDRGLQGRLEADRA